jgi:hypothetical protein
MALMNKLTASYLAGLIDGEGYIGILRTSKNQKKKWTSAREFVYCPVIKITMTDKEIIEWLYKSFGGTFETRRHLDSSRKSKESYGWMARKAQAVEIVKCVHPYLRVKKKQAHIILRYPYGKTGLPIPDHVYKQRGELYDAIRILNHRGAAVETKRTDAYMAK